MPYLKYAALAQSACKSQFLRRTPVLMDIARWTARLFVQTSLWRALVSIGRAGEVTAPQMSAYVLIVTVISSMLPDHFTAELHAAKKDDSIAASLLNPYSFWGASFAGMLGYGVYRFITVALPVMIICGCLFGILLPFSMLHALLFLAQAIAGLLLTYQLIFLFSLLALRVREIWSIKWYFQTCMMVFGGLLVPTWFYPDLLSQIAAFLPFRFCALEAVTCYIGSVSLLQGIGSLFLTVGWFLLLFAVGQLIWHRAQTRIVLNGG